jgi:hypothetical protein
MSSTTEFSTTDVTGATSSTLKLPAIAPPSASPTPYIEPAPKQDAAAVPSSLGRRIRQLLYRLYPQVRLPERRRENRYPFPYLVKLTPLDRDLQTPLGPSVVVVGKHISEHGLGFYHPTPLPYRRVLAEISLGEGTAVLRTVMDLTWCRFTREGWYDGGGRFLDTVMLPLGEVTDVEEA